jgi:hypothetical protein
VSGGAGRGASAGVAGGDLRVLAVSQHRSDPQVLIVYLHGNAGQYCEGYALEVVASVPGVLKAEESVTTPTILLALVEAGSVDVESPTSSSSVIQPTIGRGSEWHGIRSN